MRVLLLEPAYRNKFPPIGLMKIAQYHKSRGDNVLFAKGEIAGKSKKKWDRVYITTLFTFEHRRTLQCIEYAKTLVKPEQIFIGGVAATLMPKQFESDTGIRPLTGLLHCSKQLGFGDSVAIDMLVPDYSILDDISYRYPFEDAYLLTATRGCGQKCSFCAVQALEPDYVDYLPILPRIAEIDRLYGARRRLCLLDNNVLRSRQFDRIIDDIKTAGFQKNATFISPETGKTRKRYVDFNQGLDTLWITPEKTARLGEIALSPCHIAFDHIDETARYQKAITLLEQNDITDVCTYLLYNIPDFKGKGTQRPADTPKDLYERVQINAQFAKKVNKTRKGNADKLFGGFSFPMRYAPLDCTTRDYIAPNWNKKLLAGLREAKGPTNGGIPATWDSFLSIMGKNHQEFYENLLLPTPYIRERKPNGHPAWKRAILHWKRLYRSLTDTQRADFEQVVSDNCVAVEKLEQIRSKQAKTLYMFYFIGAKFLQLLRHVSMTTRDLPLLQQALDDYPELLAVTMLTLSNAGNKESIYAAFERFGHGIWI